MHRLGDCEVVKLSVDKVNNICESGTEADAQIHIFNESGFVENTTDAFKGRCIHAFHTEGAGGGHAGTILQTV